MKLEFTKMHGWGNDFVVAEGPVEFSVGQVRSLCDRRFGVGADGLLVVTPGRPVRMDYWNADGTRAEMCGNGFRCVARFAHDRGMVSGNSFEIETAVGVRTAVLSGEEIEVELGPVKVTGHTEIDGERYHLIDVGNPHAVVEVADVAATEVGVVGPRVEKDEHFEHGTNVEFVRFEDGGVSMRVWERGVGETLACGSGMVAAAFVATKSARMETPIKVKVPGGEGTVDFRDGSGWLRGPVEYVFEGAWEMTQG